MNNLINILVLEDEQRAGEKLIDLIKKLHSNVNIDWVRSVSDGITHLKNSKRVDLIFSDIELLDGNSFNIFNTITPKCPIIFCTAYSKFYVDAFKTNGIAYLLKPYTEEQFTEAWEKYIRLFINGNTELPIELINEIKSLIDINDKSYKNTFTVKKRDGIFLLNIEDISYFQAQGDFVFAIDKLNTKHVLNSPLKQVENSVSPSRFYKINRSEIININFILKYDVYIKNRLVIYLSKPKVKLFTSNSRTPGFRNWIEEQ